MITTRWALGMLALVYTAPAGAQTEPEAATATEVPQTTAAPAPRAAPEAAKTAKPAHAVPTVGVFIEPLLAIFGFLEGDVGVALGNHVTVAAWGQYFSYKLLGTQLSGYGVGLGSQIFPISEVFSGFYIYPLMKFQSVSFKVNGVGEANAAYWGPQVTLGYQWNWHPFALKLGGGGEYSFGKLKATGIDQSLSFEGFDYELDAAIGLVF